MSYIDIKQVSLQNTSSEQINPVQEETVLLLRKLLHLASSLAVTDASQRQRVVVESNANITTVTNLNTLAGIDNRQIFQDTGRNMFANAIRSKLEFS
jgi:hypothetical protein